MRPDAPAKLTSALYTSHVPAIGAAMDLGKTEEPYWKKVFDGYTWTRKWAKENTPDVVIFASVGSYAWQWAEKQGIPHGTPYIE